MKDKPKTIVKHLDELRTRILICVISFLLLACVFLLIPSFNNSISNQIIRYLQNYFLKDILKDSQLKLIFLDPLEPVFVSMKMSVLLSFIILVPLFLYQVFAFIAPAFARDRRIMISWFLSGSVVFLAIGGLLAYFVLIPATFKILINYGLSSGSLPQLTLGKFFNFTFWMFLLFSLPFELPVIIGLLVYSGIISTDKLRKIRKSAYLVILIFTAAVTPDPTPFSMLIMSACLIILYEAGIFASIFFRKGEE